MPTWDKSRLDPGIDLRRQLAEIRRREAKKRIAGLSQITFRMWSRQITDPQPIRKANKSPRISTVIDSQSLKVEKE